MNNQASANVSKMLEHIISAAKHLQSSKFGDILLEYEGDVKAIYHSINKLDIVVTRQSR